MVLISVIIPIYNGEKYVAECLDSVLNQNFSSYEILLVDDGSTDNSLLLCREYEKKFPEIKLISREHRGTSHARNIGIDNAQGEYIFLLDCDDVIHPDLFRTLDEYVIKKNIPFAATALGLFQGDVSDRMQTEQKADIVYADKAEAVEWFGDKRAIYLVFAGGKMIKRSELGATRFDEDRKIFEDVIFFQSFIGQFEIAVMKNQWYFYRMHAGNAAQEVDIKALYDALFHIRDIEKAKNHDNNADYWEEVILYAIQYFYTISEDNKNSEKQLLLQKFNQEKQGKFWKEDYTKYDITQGKMIANNSIMPIGFMKHIADNPWFRLN